VRFGILLLFAMLALPKISAVADEGELTFCNFGPKVNVVDPNHKESSDPCADKVHVQGVIWKCGNADSVNTTVSHFFDQLNQRGREECQKHCERLGSSCKSYFSAKSKCGLTTDREEAVALGKEFGCRSDCSDGKAFTYCSIYNAGYQGPNPDLVLPQAPNCECRSGS